MTETIGLPFRSNQALIYVRADYHKRGRNDAFVAIRLSVWAGGGITIRAATVTSE